MAFSYEGVCNVISKPEIIFFFIIIMKCLEFRIRINFKRAT